MRNLLLLAFLVLQGCASVFEDPVYDTPAPSPIPTAPRPELDVPVIRPRLPYLHVLAESPWKS